MKKYEIKFIKYRRILNSHAEFTNEFIVFLRNGSIGRGSSPIGESPSIYEDKGMEIGARYIIDFLEKDGFYNKAMNQRDFDLYLENKFSSFGRNNCYALSLAFYDAHEHFERTDIIESRDIEDSHIPKLCLNILNGGNHAYTNPVQSEFQEYMLVSKTNDLKTVLKDHDLIQKSVKGKLAKRDKTYVNNNLVAKADHDDSRFWVDFLQDILRELGLENYYDQMVDASAGDIWTGKEYEFRITDGSRFNPEEMCKYWLKLIRDSNLRILEDPFHEKDYESWHYLTINQNKCKIVGDNLYSGDHKRFSHGIEKKYSHGIILKPNQAGSVSNTIKAIDLATRSKQTLIMSHRSISTESTFLSHISHNYKAEYIKIGPILSDYSSVVRINEFIRLAGLGYE